MVSEDSFDLFGLVFCFLLVMKGSLLVLLVLTGVVVGSTVPLEALKEKVYGEIQDYLKENYGEGDGSNQCGKYPCCYVTVFFPSFSSLPLSFPP